MRESDTPVPSTLQRIAVNLRTVGWISFWLQLVLGVVSTIILLVYAGFNRGGGSSSQGAGFGIFFAISGLVTLGVSVYWAFRYTRIANQLKDPIANRRPSKADTIQVIQVGIIVSLVGTLLTLIGAQAIVGSTLARSLSQPANVFVAGANANQFIKPLDLFIVQANTNAIAAHFVGLVAALWLLNRVMK